MNMNRTQLETIFTNNGYVIQNEETGGATAVTHPSVTLPKRGSLYLKDNYVSATGGYAGLSCVVLPSERDHKGYPVWRNIQLRKLLAAL